ncbi:DUF4440 domain-containing protein [Shivajiella indica]|uniref:DUF4440 domain-containing protein n=1 Tax=Shivajiella indica TaxID=872115 RepID=A0ABW5BBW8_9BACT
MNKILSFLILSQVLFIPFLFGQTQPSDQDQEKILALIADYSKARENQDTLLLKSILTKEVDQLVSSGEWRTGINEAMSGMQRSSANNPGQRQLKVEKSRLLNETCAIVDARYEIISDNEVPTRRMWSTFLVIKVEGNWKIAAIRNMLPTNPN